MGHIKEPKGVDFIIKSEPLTEEEQTAITEFIRQYRLKRSKKKVTSAPEKGNRELSKKLH